ncbi:hypothetical protein GCM10018777_56880 [Streptomyces albogriseolus]|uniref:hypothetical protein n=1 Tax=Streptomyces TaxID=1883 RepID=UPI001676FD14|nr:MULTISPECIES: hypothetical protein [Streptomyces]GHB15411.1 hypothetical protein GCM10010330_81010 [Streptomyces tendae]GHG33321.1 hypothetical protein GCM10018777_56880 [Streptomyces viridodiastaticus]
MTEEEVSCLGKTRFWTLAAARTRARQIRRIGGPRLLPYQCHYCRLFHLGHKPGHATYRRKGQPLEPTT